MFCDGSQYLPAFQRRYQDTSLASSLPVAASITTDRTESVPKSRPMINASCAMQLS